jgi:site-specific recombinase XerD
MNLYRLHSTECVANLEVRFAKLPPATRRKQIKNHTDCDCVIYAYDPDYLIEWHTKGSNPRITTRLRDWKDAEALARNLEATTKDTAVHGPTLADCIANYGDYRAAEISESTKREYRLTFDALQAFAASRNVVFIREADANFFKDFKTYGLGNGEISESTKKIRFAKVRAFLGEAYDRKWIVEDIGHQIRKVRFNLSEVEQTQPYTETEVQKIMEVAGTVNGSSEGYGKVPATFRLLCELMNTTGMRVSDAIAFDPTKLTPCANPGLWLYQYYPAKHIRTHAPKLSQVYITSRLKAAIEGCMWMSASLPFSPEPLNEINRAILGKQVTRRLSNVIGPKAGVSECRAHRFRDSFAVRMILGGLGVENVSKLLNHSKVQITVDYYLPWIKQRQTMLEDSFARLMQA